MASVSNFIFFHCGGIVVFILKKHQCSAIFSLTLNCDSFYETKRRAKPWKIKLKDCHKDVGVRCREKIYVQAHENIKAIL
jgi:hypothetical protein